jgi:L-malate glycosyltransferase
MSILHLSYDYSEAKDTTKTTAVGDIVEHSRKLLKTKVISLERVWSEKEKATFINDGVLELKTFGLPLGLFLHYFLRRTASKIINLVESRVLDLSDLQVIHSHKLTFEGYIGYLLAKKFNVPLFITLRNTDIYLFKKRSDLIVKYKKILKYSSQVFYIVPYMAEAIRKFVGESFFEKHVKHKLILLPNRVDRNSQIKTDYIEGEFVTAFRMNRLYDKIKNISRLFQAISKLDHKKFTLNILGSGPYLSRVQALAKQYKVENRMKFLGHINNNDIDLHFQKAEAFILPSLKETFGMVYAEALLNGTPILYSQKTGFDGFFENVGVVVDPYSVESLVDGLKEIINRNQFFRKSIKELKNSGAFNIFKPEYSLNVYLKSLINNKIISETTTAPIVSYKS